MQNRNQLLNDHIQIRLKNEAGKISRIEMNRFDSIDSLYKRCYELNIHKKNFSFSAYKNAFNLHCHGVKLIGLNNKLFSSNINTMDLITVARKKWTHGIGFDEKTLTAKDPVTLECIEGKPIALKPGCNHILGRSTLTTWVKTQANASETPSCMFCRSPIDKKHLDKLSPGLKIKPKQNGTAIILALSNLPTTERLLIVIAMLEALSQPMLDSSQRNDDNDSTQQSRNSRPQ